MDRCLAPLVKPGGTIALAVPGVKTDLAALPPEMEGAVAEEDFMTFRSARWWKTQLTPSKQYALDRMWEFEDFDEVWSDWLQCDNPYAVSDRDMIRADGGRYMNLICIIGRRV